MSLSKGADADNAEVYLHTTLAATLDLIDVHNHNGSTTGLAVLNLNRGTALANAGDVRINSTLFTYRDASNASHTLGALDIANSWSAAQTFSGGATFGSAVGVASGGTGLATATAYAVLCGGTTSTGAFQSIASVGTSGQVLTSNGAGALPTMQTLVAVPSGAIVAYGAGTTDPSGWFLCDGRAVSRATYATLFGVVSTGYGVGDGSTTFNLPDYRGRTVFGADNMGTSAGAASRFSANNTLGSTSGEYTHTLLTGELASHTHTGPSHTHGETASTINAGGGGSALYNSGYFPSGNAGDQENSNSTTNSGGTGATGSAGSGTAHNTIPLNQIANWIIKQ